MASEAEQLTAARNHRNYGVALEAAIAAARNEKHLVEVDFDRQFARRYNGTCDDKPTWAAVLVIAAAKDAAKPYFTQPGEGSYAGWVAQIAVDRI